MYPPASKAKREAANFTERKNLQTPLYGVIEFVCLSVANFDLNYVKKPFCPIFRLIPLVLCVADEGIVKTS